MPIRLMLPESLCSATPHKSGHHPDFTIILESHTETGFLSSSSSFLIQQNVGYFWYMPSEVPLSIESIGVQIFTCNEQWHTAHARKKGSEGVRRPWVNWAARLCR